MENIVKPRGSLSIEHRLIEKMIQLAKEEVNKIITTKVVNTVFIDALADFLRIFVDLTHNGKEEDILFKKLQNKDIEGREKRMMQELMIEHVNAGKITEDLIKANKDYIFGRSKSVAEVIDKMAFLINFYPEHIRKEEKEFLPGAEKYFSVEELDEMTAEFERFNSRMIHEKYYRLYENLSKNRFSFI
jgi:hemerythrin-like domain-containing protein